MTEPQPNSLEFHQVPLSYRDWWDTLHNDRQDLINQVVLHPPQAHETINSMGVPNTFFPDMFSAFTLGGDTQRSAVLNFFTTTSIADLDLINWITTESLRDFSFNTQATFLSLENSSALQSSREMMNSLFPIDFRLSPHTTLKHVS